MATLKLEIVTPEAKTYSEDVDFVLIPGSEGELGVFPGHVPLMTELAPGELMATRDGKDEYLAIGQGFVEITQTTVSVLTDMAVMESDIDEDAAKAAIERAKAAMKDEKLGGEEQATVEASILKSLAQLKVKRRHRG
ncbi:MAG: ATP synthase F1 subunit epsilon [Terrimicrobiaceae bacterium]|nr:ATP synthase F1 subunit epsilon [Terrimicrobiaceae bacterium]